MLKSLLGKAAFAFLLLGGVMFFSNPNEDTYASYATKKLSNEIPNSICKQPELPLWLRNFGKTTSDACKSGLAAGIGTQGNSFKEFIAQSTKRDNYQVISIYTTEIPGYTVKTVGAFGNFITLQPGNNS